MMSNAVQVGDLIPEGITLYTSGNTKDKSACALPKKTDTTELFKGKKVLFIILHLASIYLTIYNAGRPPRHPIPFSPTCSMQQLPGFISQIDDLKSKGIDAVYCVNAYDIFVQDAWGKNQGADGKVMMLSDSNGELLSALGMTQDLSQCKHAHALGKLVSKRFALVVDDFKVTYVGVDLKGFEHSSVEAVMAHL
ncbi:thioredoxin-like protein [Chytridium lagenaria]|nr:thioredoxin-like protein [Chytridium lagenaria]